MLSVMDTTGSATAAGGTGGTGTVTGTGGASTAAPWIALLEEDDERLVQAALQNLLLLVDTHWHEIAVCIPNLEALAEVEDEYDTNNVTMGGTSQATSKAAAELASRVWFYLQQPKAALQWAFVAGTDLTADTPYAVTLTRTAVDAYIHLRQKQQQDQQPHQTQSHSQPNRASNRASARDEPMGRTDPAADDQYDPMMDATEPILTLGQLEPLVQSVQRAACLSGDYASAAGLCLDARHVDGFMSVLEESQCPHTWRQAAARLQHVPDTAFRVAAGQCLVRLYEDAAAKLSSDNNTQDSHWLWYDWVHALQHLRNAKGVAQVLHIAPHVHALQLCMDLVDAGDQAFLQSVSNELVVATPTAATAGETGTAVVDGGAVANGDNYNSSTLEVEKIAKYQRILTGGLVSELCLSLLHKQSKADPMVMTALQQQLEERGSRSSVLHHAAVVTHAYLHAGTTNDAFLRNNLEWMKKASNWAKFTATASLGVVHAGHIEEGMTLLEPYLPSLEADVQTKGSYAEGGSLYALGLIHAGDNANGEALALVRKHLNRSHANEALSHGACLSVGLMALGSGNVELVQELKQVLDTDNAVAGEAAGMAIGMVLAGAGVPDTLTELVLELKNYARETQHEKIIRGIAMGLALMCFGQEEQADALIEELRTDRDSVIRYGAQYAIALAYCGTGSNKAIRILLHTAVSDVSDDVRMAAVIGLAFVLFQTPERVPEVVRLLLESFNAHVRYASCMAVGIAMAGSADADSLAMLEPMLDDMVDYVRQGALMGTAMILMQTSRVKQFRDKLTGLLAEKHQSTLTKMGAILSMGILDAGGRNCALQLGSRNGFVKMPSAVGLVLWLQHWHWYPCLHLFRLALTPTITIGLNEDFKYPKSFSIVCNAKPSQFAYPKMLEEKKEKEKKRMETVTLSITAKEKARLARKKAKEGGSVAMELEEKVAEQEPEEEPKPKKKREPEPTSFVVVNPSRITKAQSLECAFDLSQRYRPVRPDQRPWGILMVTDSTPDMSDEAELQTVKAPSLEPAGELPPPEPFSWIPPTEVESNTATTTASEEAKSE